MVPIEMFYENGEVFPLNPQHMVRYGNEHVANVLSEIARNIEEELQKHNPEDGTVVAYVVKTGWNMWRWQPYFDTSWNWTSAEDEIVTATYNPEEGTEIIRRRDIENNP